MKNVQLTTTSRGNTRWCVTAILFLAAVAGTSNSPAISGDLLVKAASRGTAQAVPIRGQADVEFVKGVTRREGTTLITSIQVRNASTAPIAGLKVAETWYAKDGTMISGGEGIINSWLQPGEVQTIEIRTPVNLEMQSSRLYFSHANGSVRPIAAPSLRAAADSSRPQSNIPRRAGPMQTIPEQWHQKLTDREKAWTSQVITALRAVPDFPKLAAPVHLRYGLEPRMQINASEQDRQITVPVEMLRFLEDDASAFAFLLAHEAGHAKQEEKYGQSCYTAIGQYHFSTFDWTRTLADVVGATFEGFKSGGAQQGLAGTVDALAIAQKQACEDNADAWGIHFLRQTHGADLNGATRFFDKLSNFRWQSLTEQFTSDHSIDAIRIGHVMALIANGK
jgi:hypothetical protein